jgi:3-methyladenine DNA glycosylase Mpg
LTNGPGKLCQAFGIHRDHGGYDLCQAPLYLTDGPAPQKIRRAPRIGVDYAGSWAKRLLRFVDVESAFLSVPLKAARNPGSAKRVRQAACPLHLQGMPLNGSAK